MLPASNKGPSLNYGFPDVCLTPVGAVVVPIPYPNFAAHATAVGFVPNVLVGMIPALNLASIIPATTGDEAGVANWTFTGPATFVAGNPVVFVDMLPGINLTCPSLGNTGNCGDAMVVAPGAPNVLYTLAPTAEAAAEAGAARQALLEGTPLADEGLVAPGVGYLRVNVFSWRLPAAFDAAVGRLAAAGMRALVLDLRGCPGGELPAFLELAGDFLEAGAELCTMVDAEGDEVVHRVHRDPAHRFPLALLVNGSTASAAELFAACLAAHHRAVVVGALTYGKDTGQILVHAPSGSAVPVTAARFVAPGRGAGDERPARVVPHHPAGDEDALATALAILARPA